MHAATRLLSARAVRRLDIGVLVWVLAWILVGLLVWYELGAQAQLATDVVKVGSAVKDTGSALGVVGGLPLVGGQIGGFAERIRDVGAEVEDSGRSSRDSVHRLAVTLGLALAVLPAALLLLLYLPVRRAWRRDVEAVGWALAARPADLALEQFLARRAIEALSWDELRLVTPDPWAAVARREYRGLADAELERLGLRRPD